jgi:hypothetical protein
MKFFNLITSIFLFITATILISGSCGKGGTPPPPDPCSGITVSVTGTTTNPTTLTSSDGTITVSATGGSGFTYNLNGSAFQSSAGFTGLAAGSYTIIAKNSNGCTGTATFTLTGTNPCTGITIAVTATIINPTSTLTNNGSINATATGSSGFTFSLNGGAFQASGNFINLAVGSYTVVAKDLNGCTSSAVFTLTAPNPCSGITITVTAILTNPTAPGASNGSIAASATGGAGSYTFNINGGTFQASGTFSNLGEGNYTISAKDANGCTGSAVFTLTAPNPCAGVTIIVSNVITGNTPCQSSPNGSIVVSPTGGTGPYTYRLNSGSFQSSNIFSNLIAGNYTITAKDVNGCTGSSNALIQNLPEGPLFALVRTVLQNNCVSCHNNVLAEGGMNWTVDCNIVNFKDRIKERAVNGNPSAMPPSGLIPVSERTKITNWINAGGRFTD